MADEVKAEATREEAQTTQEISAADAMFTEAKEETPVAEDGNAVDAIESEESAEPKVEEVEDEFSKLKADGEAPEEEFNGNVEDVPLKLPPGLKPDNPELSEFVKMAKESGMKPESVQKFLDMHLTKQQNIIKQFTEADAKFRSEIDRKWIAENKSDPEFGGKNFNASNNYVQSFMRKFATKEELLWTMEKDGKIGLLQLYKDANIKNCPVLFRLLARAGKAMGEALPVTTDAPTAREKEISLADAMFGEHN